MNPFLSPTNSSDQTASLIGKSVVNPKGRSLGHVKQAVMDPDNRCVAYAVVEFEGAPDASERLFAIPISAFVYNEQRSEYILPDTARSRALESAAHRPRESSESTRTFPAAADPR
jgi:sporulation protein YlmC with PRC-barrel domain